MKAFRFINVFFILIFLSPLSYVEANQSNERSIISQNLATERVSLASDGTQGNNSSSYSSISADGRLVAFSSSASNLIGEDTNGYTDIFVHDRQTNETQRVSVAIDGTQGNNFSEYPSISADGGYVAFESAASNLINEDTNGYPDIFVYERQTGKIYGVSIATDGTQGNNMSENPSISADGRYIAFESYATNLVSGDTNNTQDVFVHDRLTGMTERVSVASDGAQGDERSDDSSISADGRYIAFESYAANLINGDTNNIWDVFVNDRLTGLTERVSMASGGTQGNERSGNPSISADGRFVAFESLASNLVSGDTNNSRDIFVHGRLTGVTERVSIASDGTEVNDFSTSGPSISGDGQIVAFWSWASNLVSGDTNEYRNIFVHNRLTGMTKRVSVASDGTQGDGESLFQSIAADGRFVSFLSYATNLVSGDTNNAYDIFVRDLEFPAFPLQWIYFPLLNNASSPIKR